jgi:uncharacterized protein (DUF2062 family)
VFKRRNPKTYWRSFVDFFYPKTGWRRALNYIGLRIKRIPDTPHKIALGFSCGVLVCFTPFFGLHFFMAAALAFLIRGNVLASLIGTFFGNPITFPIIGALSYRLGLTLLGNSPVTESAWNKVRRGFGSAFETLWINFKSIFGGPNVGWNGFWDFMNTVFFPYLIGGILPGFICAGTIYFFLRPLVAAYQKRRKGVLMAKIKERLAKKKAERDET